MDAEITEVASIDFRGSRIGMLLKIYCPVLVRVADLHDYGVNFSAPPDNNLL